MPTSKDLIDLAFGPRGGMARGRIQAWLRFNRRTLSRPQREFLEVFAALDKGQPRATYRHPAHEAKPSPNADGSLDAASLAWLERLPADPAEISFNDAVQLASLAATTKSGTSGRRLLDAIWQPVRAIHDRRQAEADLANARRPVAPIPEGTQAAVTDAIRAEVPDLTPLEASDRARRMIEDARTQRETDRHWAIQTAEQRLAEVSAETTDRQKVTAA